ncbi:MAG: tetratricopeptide repeat protein [Aquificaceae bacterium]|nr:tetratricopeptide repeat protein [Aquificaceae bacterium]
MRDIFIRLGGLVTLIILLVGGFLFWDHYRNKKLQELSYEEYEVSKLMQAGNYLKARELIKSTSSKEGPFKPLLLSYELYMEVHWEEKIDEGKVLAEILKNLKDRDLFAFYRERYAYYLFKQGKHQEALRELEGVKETDFNYMSAMLLKAQILQKNGKIKEAKEALKKLREQGSETYFANMAQALELMGESK